METSGWRERNPQNKGTQGRNIASQHSSGVFFLAVTHLTHNFPVKQQLKDAGIVSSVSTGG